MPPPIHNSVCSEFSFCSKSSVYSESSTTIFPLKGTSGNIKRVPTDPQSFKGFSTSDFEGGCAYLDRYLLRRTFLVGHTISHYDFFLCSRLTATGVRWESLRKSNKYQNLVRWFNAIHEQYEIPLFQQTSDGNADNGRKACDVDLPHTKVGHVCVRFAPEPSGYLHIGHTKAALLNYHFSEKYEGKFIVRMDDTNPLLDK